MDPELRGRNINLSVHAEEKITAQADPEMIEQVLINLVKNAAEAFDNQPDAQIVITLNKHPHQQANIIVQDNGPGIPAELVDQIFIPFFSTKNRGSGIGLSLCRQMMRLHKGRISLQQSGPEGTSFVLVW
ncbi:MAG: ATP-binding protein [Bacteroidia bacterium]